MAVLSWSQKAKPKIIIKRKTRKKTREKEHMKFGRRQGKEEKLEERKLGINMKFSNNRQVKH